MLGYVELVFGEGVKGLEVLCLVMGCKSRLGIGRNSDYYYGLYFRVIVSVCKVELIG